MDSCPRSSGSSHKVSQGARAWREVFGKCSVAVRTVPNITHIIIAPAFVTSVVLHASQFLFHKMAFERVPVVVFGHGFVYERIK